MILKRLAKWYRQHYALNVSLSALLFASQLVHLFWLTTHVVAEQITGQSYFNPGPLLEALIILVDYLEIPAIVSASMMYLYQFKQGRGWRSLVMLMLVNSQWIHLLWITDEVVLQSFALRGAVWPRWLAWFAIAIDYLELPVIYDTMKEFFRLRRQRFESRA